MKFCLYCATNGSQDKQVSRQYIKIKSLKTDLDSGNWIKSCFKVLVIYFRGLFRDKKTKLAG